MKHSLSVTSLARVAIILSLSIVANPNVFAQQGPSIQQQEEEYQERLQQVLNDKASYATAIVRRWENSARASGRWDEHFADDLYDALMKLSPENLLAADAASSFEAMMEVLATGRSPVQTITTKALSDGVVPQALGDTGADLVYTPVTPCRIVDTRNAGGPLVPPSSRTFDVDNPTSFSFQGGNNGPCGIPYGVARAVAMTITVASPTAGGYFTAWGLGSKPFSSVLNFAAGQVVANTTIVPVAPGSGNDFSLYSSATAHAVADVVGYFAAPVATALDCITVSSAVTSAPVNTWTAVDANCPGGRTATGGGYTTPEGSLGYPGVWLLSQPNGNGWRLWVDNQTNGPRSMQTFVRCCRVPGR